MNPAPKGKVATSGDVIFAPTQERRVRTYRGFRCGFGQIRSYLFSFALLRAKKARGESANSARFKEM
eukprot:10101662-Ditylum_brightwellii.AAC.2